MKIPLPSDFPPPHRNLKSSGCGEVVKQNEKVILGWPAVGVIVFYILWAGSDTKHLILLWNIISIQIVLLDISLHLPHHHADTTDKHQPLICIAFLLQPQPNLKTALHFYSIAFSAIFKTRHLFFIIHL